MRVLVVEDDLVLAVAIAVWLRWMVMAVNVVIEGVDLSE